MKFIVLDKYFETFVSDVDLVSCWVPIIKSSLFSVVGVEGCTYNVRYVLKETLVQYKENIIGLHFCFVNWYNDDFSKL